MKITHRYTYRIPDILLSAIFNGDISGLGQDDIDSLNKFMDGIDDEFDHYTWDMPKDDQESYFCRDNDVFNLACNVYDLDLVIFEQ